MLTNFLGIIKQQMFYQLWKFKLDTLLIYQFILENNLYGMITRRSLRDVSQRIVFKCYSLYYNTLLARYTEIKYQLKQSFFKNIKFDELLIEIGNFLQERSF